MNLFLAVFIIFSNVLRAEDNQWILRLNELDRQMQGLARPEAVATLNLRLSSANEPQRLSPLQRLPSPRARQNREKIDWVAHLLAGAFVINNILDLYTTFEALDRPGFYERNLLASPFISNRGLMIAVDAAAVGATLGLFYWLYQRGPKSKSFARLSMAFVNGYYASIVTDNFLELQSSR